MNEKIGGVIAAVPTAFDVHGEPDVARFAGHCEWVLANGGDGLNILGSTGEANSQSMASRALVMKAGAAFKNAGRMVGTGTPSLTETIELTQLAADLGYDAALVLPPYYYKPITDEGLFDYFATLIRSVDGIEIYLYNFPQLTGMRFSFELVERLIESFPGRLCGMKDSSGELEYTDKMASQFAGSFRVFPGSEGPLPDAVEKGYAGCISATANATVKQAAQVWRTRDDLANDDVVTLRELRGAIQVLPMVPAIKQLVSMRTQDTNWLNMLLPFKPLAGEQLSAVEAIAAQLGYG
ncbi:MAG: dihydrodipicolinate synthase family protein [Pseudomonadota bacterium]